jgi:uncharacterized protein (TIGR04255 family)
MTQRIYPKAPITEAVIDLRVVPRSDLTLADIKAVQVKFAEAYPVIEELFESQLQFQLGPNPQAHTASHHNGYRWKGSDPANVVQTRLDAFALSRLSPYDRWESFIKEARKIWDVYLEVAKPKSVSRIAVRFINRFDFPGPTLNLKDYLTVYPEFPEKQFHSVNGTLMQIQVPQPDLNGLLVVNEALIPTVVPGTIAFVLDFDLFAQGEWSTKDESVWSFLEKLRTRKDEIFEASITEKTRGLIS